YSSTGPHDGVQGALRQSDRLQYYPEDHSTSEDQDGRVQQQEEVNKTTGDGTLLCSGLRTISLEMIFVLRFDVRYIGEEEDGRQDDHHDADEQIRDVKRLAAGAL